MHQSMNASPTCAVITSRWARSMYCPLPVFRRWISATIAALAAPSPAIGSPYEIPVFIGIPSSPYPVNDVIPDICSMMGP